MFTMNVKYVVSMSHKLHFGTLRGLKVHVLTKTIKCPLPLGNFNWHTFENKIIGPIVTGS